MKTVKCRCGKEILLDDEDYKEVSKWVQSNNGWCAQVSKDGKRHHVGTFKSLRNAVIARNAKAKELYGDFANLQEPPSE